MTSLGKYGAQSETFGYEFSLTDNLISVQLCICSLHLCLIKTHTHTHTHTHIHTHAHTVRCQTCGSNDWLGVNDTFRTI